MFAYIMFALRRTIFTVCAKTHVFFRNSNYAYFLRIFKLFVYLNQDLIGFFIKFGLREQVRMMEAFFVTVR